VSQELLVNADEAALCARRSPEAKKKRNEANITNARLTAIPSSLRPKQSVFGEVSA
jgi:hypothetical protein